LLQSSIQNAPFATATIWIILGPLGTGSPVTDILHGKFHYPEQPILKIPLMHSNIPTLQIIWTSADNKCGLSKYLAQIKGKYLLLFNLWVHFGHYIAIVQDDDLTEFHMALTLTKDPSKLSWQGFIVLFKW